MTEKEATVYIVDVGKAMNEKHHEREETDLEWSMKYVWDKITSTVATGRKTLYVGAIGLRTDVVTKEAISTEIADLVTISETKNDLATEEAYANISVLYPLSQVLMPQLRSLRSKIKPSNTNDGDVISALVIAIQMIATFCKKLKYHRRIVLVTNGTGMMDAEGLEDIKSKIREDNIELVVLGVDFDDPDYGSKEEDKDENKSHNESVLKSLTESCNGTFGTMVQAIAELSIPRIKPVRPIPTFKGLLTLGDPETYETALSINVERYPRTMVARAPTASNHVIRTDLAPGESSTQSTATLPDGDEHVSPQGDLVGVKSAHTYQVLDEEAPGGKRDVERDDLAKGYEYGRTAVHISESEEKFTKLETKAGMEIVGFVTQEDYGRYMNMSRSHVTIAQKVNEKASMALSSFIHALYELDVYAVARLVAKDDKSPVMLLLAPSIEPGYECLLDVELPFAEDVRQYKFPPLDKILTISGKVLTEHRNLPNSQLQSAMSSYVDHMDLSTYGKDEEGNPNQYAAMEDIYSSTLHRINQAIRWRAVYPTDPVPPVSEILTRYSKPPEDLIKKAQPYLEKLQAAADVKKVPPKQLSKKRYRDAPKPLSGLDVKALLATGNENKRAKITISAENAIPEFKRMLETADSIADIKEAADQMGPIIEDLVRHSLGDREYARAVENIRVLREEMLELEEPGLFNDWYKAFKQKLMEGELGGDRVEMWWELRKNKVGLIDKKASSVSEVNEEEAQEFLRAK